MSMIHSKLSCTRNRARFRLDDCRKSLEKSWQRNFEKGVWIEIAHVVNGLDYKLYIRCIIHRQIWLLIIFTPSSERSLHSWCFACFWLGMMGTGFKVLQRCSMDALPNEEGNCTNGGKNDKIWKNTILSVFSSLIPEQWNPSSWYLII